MRVHTSAPTSTRCVAAAVPAAYPEPMSKHLAQADPERVPGESRDWTFVLEGGCPECGWEPVPDVARLREAWDAALAAWPALLAGPEAEARPEPTVWSPLEYGSHARDMIRALAVRIASMVEQEDPEFANWDGDLANVLRRDWAADPAELIRDIDRAGREAAAVLDRLGEADWDRAGHRGDGVGFTVLSLFQYLQHDVSHHVMDARRAELGE